MSSASDPERSSAVADAVTARKAISGLVGAGEDSRVKTIVYAGAELLTGDDIAIGVLRYCEALAGSVVAEMIEVPVREADGSVSRVILLVGPTSQMVAKEAMSEWDELIDLDVMRRLGERTRAQRNFAGIDTHGAAEDGPPGTGDADIWQAEC